METLIFGIVFPSMKLSDIHSVKTHVRNTFFIIIMQKFSLIHAVTNLVEF